MPLPSPSGLLKKQLDSVVIEANKEVSKHYNERRWEAKLHLIRKLPLQTIFAAEHLFQFSSVIPAFSKAMMPVTIHTCTRAYLTVVWWCPYILVFSSADTTRLYIFQRIGFDSASAKVFCHEQFALYDNVYLHLNKFNIDTLSI